MSTTSDEEHQEPEREYQEEEEEEYDYGMGYQMPDHYLAQLQNATQTNDDYLQELEERQLLYYI